MSEQVPLDHLILNLLALAEAAPHLSPEVRARLAGLADGLEPTVEGLSRIGLDIQTELMGVPAFDEALAAWEALVPERYGLSVDEKNRLGGNPEPLPPSGIPPMASKPEPIPLDELERWIGEALQDPETLSRQPSRLQRLAGLVGQFSPRR
jgi:hypothetical protein